MLLVGMPPLVHTQLSIAAVSPLDTPVQLPDDLDFACRVLAREGGALEGVAEVASMADAADWTVVADAAQVADDADAARSASNGRHGRRGRLG